MVFFEKVSVLSHEIKIFHNIYSHLSKRPSDFKQNGTQAKTPFSGTVFHTLSHGVLCFVASVSFKKTID